MQKAAALKESLISKGVGYCIGAYVDIHGEPKGQVVPISRFQDLPKSYKRFVHRGLTGYYWWAPAGASSAAAMLIRPAFLISHRRSRSNSP